MTATITAAETDILRALHGQTDYVTTTQVREISGRPLTATRKRKLVNLKLIEVIRIGRKDQIATTEQGAIWVRQDAESRTPEAQLEPVIRTAHAKLADRWNTVKLVDLRAAVAAPRELLDAALERMARLSGVHVRAEADQKTLTEADRKAAVVLGGTARHLLTIEG